MTSLTRSTSPRGGRTTRRTSASAALAQAYVIAVAPIDATRFQARRFMVGRRYCPLAAAADGGNVLNILSTACAVAAAFEVALFDSASLAKACQIASLVFASKMSTTSVAIL